MEAYEIDATRNPVVFVEDGKVFTTSADVAVSFGKQHGHVLRDIDRLCEQRPKLRLSIFGETVAERENPSGGAPIKSRIFNINRDGFTLLAMGFNGAKALDWKLRYIDAFNAMEAAHIASGALPGADTDHLAELSGRVHAELAEYRGFVGKEIGGVKGALLHYVKEYVVNPVAGMRQYLEDRFRAILERDKMLLGNDAAIMESVTALRRENAAVLTFARRALDPEAFIRPEWCDVEDVYRLSGVVMPIPRRNILSTQVHNALDGFCKMNSRQEDMRAWPHAGKQVSYWRKTAVQAWMRASGGRMIRQHCDKHRPPSQGVLPFRKKDG